MQQAPELEDEGPPGFLSGLLDRIFPNRVVKRHLAQQPSFEWEDSGWQPATVTVLQPEMQLGPRWDEGTNIAALDPGAFERLVRGLFEQEFRGGGGQIQPSRPSPEGVDLVVLDPDPLRGGRILIRAMQAAQRVDVPAARELYAALRREGASKGIFITTTDFAPDVYAFIRDKPLALITGAQLLQLLQMRGHKFRINLVEARKA